MAALVLLLAPFQASAASLGAQGQHDRRCHDHACACSARHCPPKKPAGGCHESTDAPLQLVPGACHHPQATTGPGVVRPHVVPEMTGLAWCLDARGAHASFDRTLQAGFREIDLPPPRRLS